LKFVLCNNRVHRWWSGIAQTQQIIVVVLIYHICGCQRAWPGIDPGRLCACLVFRPAAKFKSRFMQFWWA